MELDSRIIEGKRPFTCLDIEQAKEFEGKLCLFSSSFMNYKNISEYAEYPQYTGILTIRDKVECSESKESREIGEREECPFRNGNDGYFYEFALPLEWIKEEKRYRPYKNVQEFFEDVGCDIGDIIRFRRKTDDTEYRSFIAGTSHEANGVETVFLCNRYYTMRELFEYCEMVTSHGYEPFGVLEDEE